MKNYTVTNKTEHANGFTITCQEFVDGKASGEAVTLQTSDAKYAAQFPVNGTVTIASVKAK